MTTALGRCHLPEGGDLSSLAGLEGGTRLNFLGRCLLCKVQVSGVG